jgi:hypothetical protein
MVSASSAEVCATTVMTFTSRDVTYGRWTMFRQKEYMIAAYFVGTLLALATSAAQAQEPLKIGYSIAQTGGLAPNGRSALLAHQIWEEDINAKGGLLGRRVKLICYDDQSNPATVPAIYEKLRRQCVLEVELPRLPQGAAFHFTLPLASRNAP